MPKYLIKGELYNPIKYGEEEDCWGNVEEGDTCPDCGCKVGQQHLDCCDVERCPRCGLQFISCDCGIKYNITKDMMEDIDIYIEAQKRDNKDYELRCKKALEEYKKKNKDSEM